MSNANYLQPQDGYVMPSPLTMRFKKGIMALNERMDLLTEQQCSGLVKIDSSSHKPAVSQALALEQFTCNVLLVEGSTVNDHIINHFLTRLGARVKRCFSAETAFSLLQQHSYDVIFSDVQLPHASGLDLLNIVREKNNIKPQGEFVAISVYISDDEKARFMEQGAFDVLEKPIILEEFADTLSKAVDTF